MVRLRTVAGAPRALLRRWRTAAVLCTGALLLAGCSADGGSGSAADSTPSRTAAPGTPPLPASLTKQRLDWGPCRGSADSPAPGTGWECATMRAPLDWAKPGGETMGIALIRGKSSGHGSRIGSLVFNFGGPGSSGVAVLPSFADSYDVLRDRYDLVSFDPRGVGGSGGVRCRTDRQLRTAETVDLSPDTPAEEKAYFQDAADFGAGCKRSAGSLLAHLSTADTARDMDLMRALLGDSRLHYFGVSYGTELGGVYAHLFPAHVGRLLLDAVVDPTADTTAQEKNQTRGFQRALDNYLSARGQDPKEGTRRIAALLRRMDAEPLPTDGNRKLTQSLAVVGITVTLYSKQTWPQLTRALDAAEHGDGTDLLRLADSYNERSPSGHYGTQSHAQRAISCRDSRQRPTAAEAKQQLASFRKISPVFGELLGWDSAGWCHDWPVPGLEETPDVSAPGAAPVLVVGNTGDPATPYEGARRMADELGKDVGVELTWKGQGHGAYGSGSSCIDDAIDTYLLDGTPPKDGKVCS